MNVKKARIMRYILLITTAIMLLWGYSLNEFVRRIPSNAEGSVTKTDAIVMFTGGQNRLLESISLLNNGLAKKLFISGVGSDADLTNTLILSGRLPDNIADLVPFIELGYEAQNTRGNALEVEKWVKKNNIKSIRLVTANYHIERSLFELSKRLPELKIISNPVFSKQVVLGKWWRSGGSKKLFISEFNKYLISKYSPF